MPIGTRCGGMRLRRFLLLLGAVALLGVSGAAVLRYHLYIPTTISPAAQRDLRVFANGLDIGYLPAPGDLASWKRVQRYGTAAGPAAVLHTERRLDLTIAHETLGGVPVLDIRPRAWKPEKRVIVYFHGGAYVLFSAETMITMPAMLSRFTGERAISVDYTLAPEAHWATIQHQALSVVEALRAQGMPVRDMALMGDSAGGNLAIETILGLRHRHEGVPAAAILISPWVDLTDRGDTMHTLAGQDPILTYDHSLANAALAYAGGTPLTNPEISPIYARYGSDFPPALIQDGTKDILLSGSVRLYRAIVDSGGIARLDLYEGMWHDFESWSMPESQTAYGMMARFLQRYQR